MRCLAAIAIVFLPVSTFALETEQGAITVTPEVTGLDAPWGVAELPDGSLLVTERDGRLVHASAPWSHPWQGRRALPPEGRAGFWM